MEHLLLMHLAEVIADNFRTYGTRTYREGQEEDNRLRVAFNPGITVLVGENDSGKSAIVDAVRFCLSTTTNEFSRVSIDDFHCTGGARASSLAISCKFAGLSDEEQGKFLELLTVQPDGETFLFVTLTATRAEDLGPNRVAVITRSGPEGAGPPIEGSARELLRATYLRPLRDAEAELRSGRGSRLSQILASYPDMQPQHTNDFDPEADTAKTLVGILKRAEHGIASNTAIATAAKEINTEYLERFQIGNDTLASSIGVTSDTTLRGVLERLELIFSENPEIGERTRRGLGYNNALFMAAELLLLGKTTTAPLLLIEEPEAHLHPQLQSRVMELLVEKASQETHSVQVVITTHSPNVASSIPVEDLTLVARGRTYSLDPETTQLDPGDYQFLRRFLDVTKANLFFARGVAIVEGDAEAILLPALAKKVGKSFSRLGVSVVNVGHIGLFRYSRIFQRHDSTTIPVRVACFRDRDIAPANTDPEMRKKLPIASDFDAAAMTAHVDKLRSRDGGPVRTFVSDYWTLEYDIAASSWQAAGLMHAATRCALISDREWPSASQMERKSIEALEEVQGWKAEGRSLTSVALEIYRPLRMNDASKAIAAQHAARLIEETSISATDLPDYLGAAFSYLDGGEHAAS